MASPLRAGSSTQNTTGPVVRAKALLRYSTVTPMKARRIGAPLSSTAPAYRFALGYVPPLVAGMILTPVFATMGLMARLP